MKKPKLLYNTEYWSNLVAFFLEPIWDEYFQRVKIDPEQNYDPATHVVFADFRTAAQWLQPWRDRGFKIVLDHTWDTWVDDGWQSDSHMLVLRNNNWSWYNESLWYQALGYNNYIPNRVNDKTFLMLMNLRKNHRSEIYNKIKPWLNGAIYSYQGIGQPMVGGTDIDPQDPNWQRYIDPDWYNTTKFSVVVESNIIHNHIVHSEKSYKPMAFKHPTISWGSPGLLKYLRHQGFVTFDNCINESYDNMYNDQDRLDAVIDCVKTVLDCCQQDPNYFNDPETQARLEHNYNWFYNNDLIKQRFKAEIIDPMTEFVCKH